MARLVVYYSLIHILVVIKITSSDVIYIVSVAAKVVNSDYDDFKFKDFNPIQFARIRTMCGINPSVSHIEHT